MRQPPQMPKAEAVSETEPLTYPAESSCPDCVAPPSSVTITEKMIDGRWSPVMHCSACGLEKVGLYLGPLAVFYGSENGDSNG